MNIGLVYSDKDPKQTNARDFLRRFVKERGITATIVETPKAVSSPTLIIDGFALRDMRCTPRQDSSPMFPAIKDIAAALERSLWSL